MLSHQFADIVKCAGLEHLRFHDLRHTFASLALMRGAKPKVFSEALGHASIAFTMDVYSHIIEGMQSEMMACWMTSCRRQSPTSNERQRAPKSPSFTSKAGVAELADATDLKSRA